MEDMCDEMDLKIINFIKMINNKDTVKKPEPRYFTISTQSAMCRIDGINNIDLSKVVVYIAKKMIKNIVLKENPDYLIKGLVVDNIIIRYDDVYLKKYKRPIVKYMGNVIDIYNDEECHNIYDTIQILENNSLKKHGRQKIKKENEYFYNSCSIIVKATNETKSVNIKLFNNGQITMTGSKNEYDGYYSCCILLDEMKQHIESFPDLIKDEILDEDNEETIKDKIEANTKREMIFNNLKIVNYQITMINSDFNTNFKIDLIKLLNILNTNEKELFTKFNPEKYRGLIIGYYWNNMKKIQDGKCICKTKCKGKGLGNGEGDCKKITIAIFKSGSIIITGGRLVRQIEDAYKTVNELFDRFYHDIIKLSILDFMDDENEDELDKEQDNLQTEEVICKEIKPIKNTKSKISNPKLINDNNNNNNNNNNTKLIDTKQKIIRIKLNK